MRGCRKAAGREIEEKQVLLRGCMMSQRERYTKRLEDFTAQAGEYKKQSNRISTLRLLTFLGGGVLAWLCFSRVSAILGWVVTGVSLALFIFLVIRHTAVKQLLERAECKARINGEYLDRLSGEWKAFKDNGQELVDPEHPFTGDLDIFGEKSLFQYLNVTRTYYGRQRLSQLLSNPARDPEVIKKQQGIVKDMVNRVDFSQELQCESKLNSKIGGNPETLIAASENDAKRFKQRWTENIFYIIPALTLLSIAFAGRIAIIPDFMPVLLIIIQLIVFALGYRKNSEILINVGKFKNDIMVYSRMIGIIEAEDFSDASLKALQARFGSGNNNASKRLKKLEGISEAADTRFSPLLHFLLNLFLLWDYHCIFAFEEWKRKNGKAIRGWLETIGEIEAFLSLAVLGELHPDWCYPTVTDRQPTFRAVALGHPLLPDGTRVCNDVDIRDQLCVITGSNMSGKTTLLRTIGINLVLAYTGAPVCAKTLDCSMMAILTSMRINDDLSSGISTFYAELLRIKMIIDFAKKRENMIFLIDELFRGTNSKDRITGAIHVLKALNRDWIIGLISTHDFELCALENESRDRIKNYHFNESYSQNQIHFDYKLKSGRSTTTNARYLMKMVGIDIDAG